MTYQTVPFPTTVSSLKGYFTYYKPFKENFSYSCAALVQLLKRDMFTIAKLIVCHRGNAQIDSDVIVLS